MDEQKERSDFEEWSRSIGSGGDFRWYSGDGGRYLNLYTDAAWQAWKARATGGEARSEALDLPVRQGLQGQRRQEQPSQGLPDMAGPAASGVAPDGVRACDRIDVLKARVRELREYIQDGNGRAIERMARESGSDEFAAFLAGELEYASWEPAGVDVPVPAKPEWEYGWLVENGKKQGEGLAYRFIDNDEGGIPRWTEDPNKALRFARRADAEQFAHHDEDAWRIVEHGFAAGVKEDQRG